MRRWTSGHGQLPVPLHAVPCSRPGGPRAGGNEVCATAPGFAEDVRGDADTAHLVRWYASEMTLAAAQHEDGMTVPAPRWLERLRARMVPAEPVPRAHRRRTAAYGDVSGVTLNIP